MHPCKTMQDNALIHQERQRLQQMSVQYGSHLAMRTVADRNIMGRVQRLGGYKSSNHGVNMNMGRYETFGFEDFLNMPYETPDFEYNGVRDRVEQAYGMQ